MLDLINKHLKDAMRSKDKKRISSLRNILAKLKMKQIEKKESLTEAESIKVMQSMSKQLKDSIEQFKRGERDDLAMNETDELNILKENLKTNILELLAK